MTIETLGIDIAKNVFQLHGVNRGGRVVFKRRVMRDQLLEVVCRLDRCTIAVEACRVLFTGRASLKDLAIRSGSSAHNMSSRLCDGRRMTATMQRRSAQLHVSLTFPSFRRRRSNNRIFRLFTVRASVWLTTGLQSSARSAGYYSIVGSRWRKALRERDAWFPRSLPIRRMS